MSDLNVRIHRGAEEVGGTVVELEFEGDRIVLEAGLPLNMDGVMFRDLQPDLPGLWAQGDGSLKGLMISHGHPDHYGLADLVDPSVPIYMGKAAKEIIDKAAFFSGRDPNFSVFGHLEDRKALRIGKFKVTPFLVDHSGFDAYALLVEAGARKLFYSGDLRGHGRKTRSFQRLISDPPHDVDCLLLEGTTIGRPTIGKDDPRSEVELEDELVDRFRNVTGAALAFYSAQNIDRLVTMYKAAVRSGRTLVLDLYGATIAAATGSDSIPKAGWEDVRVFVPMNQRIRVKRSGEFWRVNELGKSRVYLDEISEEPEKWVITARMSYLSELDRARCLVGARAFWMMWRGYLEDRERLEFSKLGIQLIDAHVTGHATLEDLVCLKKAVGADKTVPIHTESAVNYESVIVGAQSEPDGRWWTCPSAERASTRQ